MIARIFRKELSACGGAGAEGEAREGSSVAAGKGAGAGAPQGSVRLSFVASLYHECSERVARLGATHLVFGPNAGAWAVGHISKSVRLQYLPQPGEKALNPAVKVTLNRSSLTLRVSARAQGA